ncbi:MAG: Holliday junction branch migration protein RuvA [Deltaproteobacteria bacterium]|nr:Holliday junction branch migration protein RuvA [Deltaproteobacteria bacterium]MBW2072815.1 Holliday junction branch migration protein RuvA [Deltaproteobacteria bacterium]
MIAHIQGSLLFKSPECVIIDVGGVGYEIYVPLTTFYELPENGGQVSLHTYTHVREKTLQLYGFQSRQEKQLFELLLSVTGIGPRLAINILSSVGVAELATTIRQEDLPRLVAIPGLGRKTAERLVVELRDKLAKMDLPSIQKESPPQWQDEAIMEDALSALLNLGYKAKVAKKALNSVWPKIEQPVNLQSLLKEALRALA